MEIIELKVPMHDCEACERHIKKALSRMIGVEKVEVDMEKEKVTVTGYGLNHEKVLRKARRTMKLAELFPFGHNHHRISRFLLHHVIHDPYRNSYPINSTSHYSKHGKTRSNHLQLHHHHKEDSVDFWRPTFETNILHVPEEDMHNSTIVYAPLEDILNHEEFEGEEYYKPPSDDKLTTMFANDNPNACSIM